MTLLVLAGCTDRYRLAGQQPAEVGLAEQVREARQGESREIRVELANVGDQDLVLVHDLAGLKRLILERATVTDAGVAALRNLPSLEEVRIIGGQLGDAGLEHLCGLASVERLNLPQTEVTDKGLAALSRLPNLIQLRLGSRRISDAGMEAIAQLGQLRFLHLIDVGITDAGLAKLERMTGLESLYLDRVDGVSEAGLDRLLKALPELHFHRDQQHLPGDPKADRPETPAASNRASEK